MLEAPFLSFVMLLTNKINNSPAGDQSISHVLRVLILMSLCATSPTGTQFGTFKRLTSPDGATLCITGPPDGVTCLRDNSETGCGVRCLVQAGCEAYNVRQTADCSLCQMFNNWPTNVSVVTGCTGYVSQTDRGRPTLILKSVNHRKLFVYNVLDISFIKPWILWTFLSGSNNEVAD